MRRLLAKTSYQWPKSAISAPHSTGIVSFRTFVLALGPCHCLTAFSHVFAIAKVCGSLCLVLSCTELWMMIRQHAISKAIGGPPVPASGVAWKQQSTIDHPTLCMVLKSQNPVVLARELICIFERQILSCHNLFKNQLFYRNGGIKRNPLHVLYRLSCTKTWRT